MKNFCTLYAHELCYDSILEQIQTTFPKAKITQSQEEDNKLILVEHKQGVLKGKKTFQVRYREKAQPGYQIKTIDSVLTQNLAAMANFVSTLPTSNKMIQELLIQKIQTINSEIAILTEDDLKEELQRLVKKITAAIDGFIFCTGPTLSDNVASAQFLDQDLNVIQDSQGFCEVDSVEVSINSKYFDADQNNPEEDQESRKQTNEEVLKQNGVKVNANLPLTNSEADVALRSPKEIAERVVVLAVTNMVAFNTMEGAQALEYLEHFELLDKATPKEMDFLKDPTEEKKSYETWKCEGIWVLMWALHKVSELGFPNKLADLNQIAADDYPIAEGADPNEFIASIENVRKNREIMDANDLYYRLDWACVDARINGQEMEAVHPGVVYERHYALNWLIHYQDQEWDDVTCDT